MSGPTHEDPLLIVLPPDGHAGRELAAFCTHDLVRQHLLPPVWALEAAGIDLPGARPDLRSITLETLPEVAETLTRLCDPTTLAALVRRRWAEVDEMVRDFYLRRSTLQTMAAIFKLAPHSLDREPPPSFRVDRIHEHGLEVQYRLAAAGGPGAPQAPPEEGSIVYYPFDPRNGGAREEAGLRPGAEVVLEAFAYAPARGTHRAALEQIGGPRGWRVLDPQSPA